MAADVGRNITITIDGDAVAGVRSKNPSYNKEPVDITDDDSSGWRELLAEPGQREINIPVSGVTKDDTLRSAYFANGVLHNVQLQYPDGGVIQGSFFLASYAETGEYNAAITFDAEFQSSGPIAYNGVSQ